MSILVQRRERSVAVLDRFLARHYGGQRLNNDELIDAELFGAIDDAWSIQPGAPSPVSQLYVGVDGRYPATLPRVLLPNPAQWHLHIPHVGKEGGICAVPEQATGDAGRLTDVADEIIRQAVSTIGDGISGKNRADFVSEIESYWAGVVSEGATPVWSLVKPEPPSREISCVACKGFLLVGNTPAQCQHWMRNYARRDLGTITPGLFVWTQRGLYPDEYFQRNGELLAFLEAEDPGFIAKLAKLADGRRQPIPVVIAMPAQHGSALLGVSLNDQSSKPHEKLRGFRPGHLPPRLFTRRFSRDQSTRHIVRRIYPQWIHSRGGAKGMEALAEKKITLIGCGALGGDVAQMLAKAGVQRMSLIDSERLDWDNIGRHLLGAKEVGRHKSAALRDHLLGQFPHMDVSAEMRPWEELIGEKPQAFVDSDLVISLTGEWASDSALNLLARSRSRPPVLFGWTEPHGYAGHALLVSTRGGCLACGRNEFGEVRNKVTEWGLQHLERVPACGGFYEPYGAVETAPIKSVIASLAIETLRRDLRHSELRTWIGNVGLIEELGGKITESWQTHLGDESVLGKIVRQKWLIHPLCAQCREA
jgi:hypothetical protein